MTPIVFLGPSLPRDAAERLIHAEFRPPVQRGDYCRRSKVAQLSLFWTASSTRASRYPQRRSCA